MKACDNISALARELGIRRKLLYKWKDEAEEAAKYPQRRVEQPTAEERLAKRVRELEALGGRQSEEIDFFKGALQRIEERRRKREQTSGAASTSKSSKQTRGKAD